MSKSNSNTPNTEEISPEVQIEALKSQVNYWKTRYKVLKKYGNINPNDIEIKDGQVIYCWRKKNTQGKSLQTGKNY